MRISFLANLRISDLRTGTPSKFEDFRFANLSYKLADLLTDTSQKFADLCFRNEPKNLRFVVKLKKFACPPLQC
jgi:hypothetical protein